MSLSFGKDNWKNIISREDFYTEIYPPEDELEDSLFRDSYRFVDYDLRDRPMTDDAYRGLIEQLEDENESKDTSFRAGELLGEIVLEATEENLDEWSKEQFYGDNPGRARHYEKHGSPFLRILDSSEGIGTRFATRKFNTVAHLKERYEKREDFNPPEGFLNGMDKVQFDAAYTNYYD